MSEAKIDNAVAEIISKLVSNPKFADMMQQKINLKVDTSAIEEEIKNYQKRLTTCISTKRTIEKQMDLLDVEDKHYYNYILI